MSPRTVFARRSLMVGWDMAAWITSLLAFSLVRYDLVLSDERWSLAATYTCAAVLLQLLLGFHLHLYLGRSKVGSYAEASTLAVLVGGIAVTLGLGFVVGSELLLGAQQRFSLGLAVLVPALAFLIMAAGRWAFRAMREYRRKAPSDRGSPVLVYGAGDIGHQVARLVDREAEPPYAILGFVDDDPSKRWRRIGHHRVLGRGEQLIEIARASGAEGVILAVSKAESAMIATLNDRCRDAGLSLVIVPPVREMIGGQVRLDQLREFNVVDLLGRRPVETDVAEIAEYVTGKAVLVTGAGGSIGSELAQQVHRLGPTKLVLLDRDESALHATQLRIYGSGLLDSDDIVLCDIRDVDALRLVFERHRPEVVFHAAALKHLPMLERFPAEGWKTNVVGSLNVLQCAADAGVRHFVNISTDKAADPSSVLGRTKLLAERLTSWFATDLDRPYVSVRFGNVLGSRGSVLYTFRAQIERGGPVTVTHPDVTRFFMTIPEACELVLQAGAIGSGGEVLVLDMGEPVRIVDVAKRLIEESGARIKIEFTGLRPGEKLHEILFSDGECGVPSAHPFISKVPVARLDPIEVLLDDSDIGVAVLSSRSHDGVESGREADALPFRSQRGRLADGQTAEAAPARVVT